MRGLVIVLYMYKKYFSHIIIKDETICESLFPFLWEIDP